MIEVRLFATFRLGRQKSYSLSVEEYRTARDVCTMLDINSDDVAILLINGFHSKLDDELKDGDLVLIFPPCAGG